MGEGQCPAIRVPPLCEKAFAKVLGTMFCRVRRSWLPLLRGNDRARTCDLALMKRPLCH